jgi:hypothetical protein
MREKRKKSWKEIDRQRDRSQHRRDERPGAGRPRGGDASRSRRSALDQLFSSGKIADLVKQRDQETGVEASASGPSRRQLGQAILEATDRNAKLRAIDAYLEAFSMPRDLEVLAHVLDHPDDEVVEQALDQIATCLAEDGPPRRARTLRAQLKIVADLSEWGKLRRRAEALLDQL